MTDPGLRPLMDDKDLLAVVAFHIEQPMKTAVALFALAENGLEGNHKDILQAASEEVIVDLVTSAFALTTASWAVVGHDILATPEDYTLNGPWMESLLDRALDAARLNFEALRLDYDKNVGPIPDTTQGGN